VACLGELAPAPSARVTSQPSIAVSPKIASANKTTVEALIMVLEPLCPDEPLIA
jgi:hypothetical protein